MGAVDETIEDDETDIERELQTVLDAIHGVMTLALHYTSPEISFLALLDRAARMKWVAVKVDLGVELTADEDEALISDILEHADAAIIGVLKRRGYDVEESI